MRGLAVYASDSVCIVCQSCADVKITASSSNVKNYSADLYSVEYRTADFASLYESIGDLNNYEVPCAVCTKARSAGLQVWGTDACPHGVAKAYDGYVMAEHGGYRCCLYRWVFVDVADDVLSQ